jgi:hypothetical protein
MGCRVLCNSIETEVYIYIWLWIHPLIRHGEGAVAILCWCAIDAFIDYIFYPLGGHMRHETEGLMNSNSMEYNGDITRDLDNKYSVARTSPSPRGPYISTWLALALDTLLTTLTTWQTDIVPGMHERFTCRSSHFIRSTTRSRDHKQQ